MLAPTPSQAISREQLAGETTASATSAEIGQLRLRYTYARQFILPISAYSRLVNLLLQDNQFRLLTMLGRATADRDQVTRHIVSVFEQNAKALPFLQHVVSIELRATKDANTLFRANSVASKAIDQYLKLVGGRYLVRMLRPVIMDILTQNRPCELDPTRLAAGEDVAQHLNVLETFVRLTLDRIFESVKECPPTLRQLFAFMKREAELQFPDVQSIGFIAITSFLFLRYFNAAILGI
jgi:hypothetical protein